MDAIKKGRKIIDEPGGQIRIFRAEDDACISFERSPVDDVLIWSTKEPAVLAIRSLLEREVAEHDFDRGSLMYGPVRPGRLFKKKRDWRKVWDKFSILASTFPEYVHYVRFDSRNRVIGLESLEPRFDVLGIAYMVGHGSGKPAAADVEALRRAFSETAADSLKPELDWILESLNP